MDTELNEKQYVQNHEVDEWITSLYTENATFDIEFEGKLLKFKKRMPLELAFKIREQNKGEDQLYSMIAILSVTPVLKPDQIKKLPQDAIKAIQEKLEIYFTPEKNNVGE